MFLLGFYLVFVLESVSQHQRTEAYAHLMDLAYQEGANSIKILNDENLTMVKVVDRAIASAPPQPCNRVITELIVDPYLKLCNSYIKSLSDTKKVLPAQKVN